jgi:hypothetical protein
MNHRSAFHVENTMIPRPWLLSTIFLLSVIIATGCTGSPGGIDGTWIAEHEVDGNITTVRTISGSVWGGRARLIEEASIGSVDGPDEQLIGRASSIYADDERIYVGDGDAVTVRVYDREGTWLFNVGRRGEGPGEFSRPRSISVHPVTGDIFVRDGNRTRINRYTSTGEIIETWRLKVAFSTSLQSCMTFEGDLYTPVIVNISAHSSDWRWGMAHCLPEGAVGDTIPAPWFDYEQAIIEVQVGENMYSNTFVPFTPSDSWVMLPSLNMVGGVSTDYRFEIHHPDGRLTIVEREGWERIPVEPGERQWYRDYNTATYRQELPGWAWNGPDIPFTKPPFEQFLPDRSGRIWVIREGRGIHLEGGDDHPETYEGFRRNPAWQETWFVDVFDEEGRFLGEVEIPERFGTYPQPFIDGETVIAEVPGEDGTPYVKRYRLELPGEGD